MGIHNFQNALHLKIRTKIILNTSVKQQHTYLSGVLSPVRFEGKALQGNNILFHGQFLNTFSLSFLNL